MTTRRNGLLADCEGRPSVLSTGRALSQTLVFVVHRLCLLQSIKQRL